jgi:hypothetical protein
MKTTGPCLIGINYSCFPETDFEKKLFGCNFIVIAKHNDADFVFWYETPDIYHLSDDEYDRVVEEEVEFIKAHSHIQLPEEFRQALEKELSSTDGVDGLLWNDSSQQWEHVPLME